MPGGTGGGFGPGGAGGQITTGNGAPTGGGGPGGILSTSESSAELTAALQSDSDRYRWVAATISANQAAGYQLASEEPVMAIGGFNGTDPSPTLAEFQQYVENGDIHYFIAGNGGAGPGGGANGAASAITTWVAEQFDTVTVDGTTLYDLTSPLASTADLTTCRPHQLCAGLRWQTRPVLLADLVDTSSAVAATRSRTAKVAALAGMMSSLDADEIVPAVAALCGAPRQGKIGIGWATSRVTGSASAPSLTIGDLDRTLSELAVTTGSGSQAARRALLDDLAGRATPAESDFIRRLLIGELRQGALAGLVQDAVAKAAGLPAPSVRRAAMLTGDLPHTAWLALDRGGPGARGDRAPGRYRGAPDAGLTRDRRRRRARRYGLGIGRMEARRRSHPGPPRWGGGAPLHPQSQRGDRPTPGAGRRDAVDGGRIGHPRRRDHRRVRGGPARRVPGLDVELRAKQGCPADDPVGRVVRRVASRRCRPDRSPAVGTTRRDGLDRRPRSNPVDPNRRPRRRAARSSTRRSRRATKGSWSRT